jgi:hypothetical protein
MAGVGVQPVQDAGRVLDHAAQSFKAREIVPTKTIPDLYREGALSLHLHVRSEGRLACADLRYRLRLGLGC